MNHNTFPPELTALPQWTCYKLVSRRAGEKLTKPPYQVTGHRASVTDPRTWAPFATVLAAVHRFDGLGFVFTAEDPYLGIDVDHCRDVETGALTDTAQWVVAHVLTYTEISPSGTGLHLIVRGAWPFKIHREGKEEEGIEVYDMRRYFTMTGHRLAGTPDTIATISPETLQELYDRFFPTKTAPPLPEPPREPSSPSPVDLLKRMFASKAGAQIQRLWDGDTSGFPSQSEADLALASHLAWWTQKDAGEIDQLFRLSGLMRKKWTRKDYRTRTITKALNQAGQYDPQRSTQDILHFAYDKRSVEGNKTEPQGRGGEPRMQIPITLDITAMVEAAIRALREDPDGPRVFQHAWRLVHIVRDGTPPRMKITRAESAPVITAIPKLRLMEILGAVSTWIKYDQRKKEEEEPEAKEVRPPGDVAATLMARGQWDLPMLESVLTSPTLRPDGTILARPGYDPETGLFLDISESFPSVPLDAGIDEARSAIGLLQEVLQDFPFIDQHHWSAAYALVLTMVGRHAIDGSVPLFGVSATAPGTGKGKLVQALSIIAHGHLPTIMPPTSDGEEDRKRLFAVAASGDVAICIDNVERPLGSSALNMVLTAGSISDRVLGSNLDSRTLPWKAVLMATGNNLRYRGDMPRRVIPIALDARVENPQNRTGFKHPDLLPWVRRQRKKLLVAALTILHAYFNAGCPGQKLEEYGSFEAWSALIRGALVWCGETDPLVQQEALIDHPELENYGELLAAWISCYPQTEGKTQHKTLGQIRDDIEYRKQAVRNWREADGIPKPNLDPQWITFFDALAAFDARFDGRQLNVHRIGNALRVHVGLVLNGRALRKAATGRIAQWSVEETH